MSGLDDIEATSPPSLSVRHMLARLAAVLGAGAVAVVLLAALVVFGPFGAVRSLFVSNDSEWGTCVHFTISSYPCHGLPLSTVDLATGFDMPAGTRVVDSAAGERAYDGGRNMWALLSFPAGKASPLADPAVSTRSPSIPLAKLPFSTAVSSLKEQGVRNVEGFRSTDGSGKSWWALTGTSGGRTYL